MNEQQNLMIISSAEDGVYIDMQRKQEIDLDDKFNIKICDFAMSKSLVENMDAGIFYSQCGSERYMAPEIIEGRPYKGTSVDIYALGVSLFAMVTGVMPFESS